MSDEDRRSHTSEVVCPKCRLMGCECVAPSSLTAKQDICIICRRHKALCICRSHATYTEPTYDGYGEPVPAKTIDAKVSEALRYYYDRDPQGLAKFVRELLGAR